MLPFGNRLGNVANHCGLLVSEAGPLHPGSWDALVLKLSTGCEAPIIAASMETLVSCAGGIRLILVFNGARHPGRIARSHSTFRPTVFHKGGLSSEATTRSAARE